ncbi:MAG: hypothetical protein ACO2OS_05445 [Thermosphaera aggregans]|uniref:hypothetical protein n=1 Tax=Thermosphaera aggregans TaxID=54254 RepID=UPI003BFB9C96
MKTAIVHYKFTSSFTLYYYVEKLDKWVWIFYPWSFSETLNGLARQRGGEVIEATINVLRELNASELNLDRHRVKSSLTRCIEKTSRA